MELRRTPPLYYSPDEPGLWHLKQYGPDVFTRTKILCVAGIEDRFDISPGRWYEFILHDVDANHLIPVGFIEEGHNMLGEYWLLYTFDPKRNRPDRTTTQGLRYLMKGLLKPNIEQTFYVECQEVTEKA